MPTVTRPRPNTVLVGIALGACWLAAGSLPVPRGIADEQTGGPAEVNVSRAEQVSEATVLAGPIPSGFLLVDGRYIGGPYQVELLEGRLLINGHATSLPPHGGWNWPPPGGGMGWRGVSTYPPRAPRWRQAGPLHIEFAKRLERDLGQDGLVVIFDEEYPFFFSSATAAEIFAILLSKESPSVKVARLGAEPACSQISAERWTRAVATFQPAADFSRRAGAVMERERALQVEAESVMLTSRWYNLLSSKPAQYGVTLTAMLLGVVALGNLLLYRPHSGRWSEVCDEPNKGVDMRRIIGMLALLSVFDLFLTLAAQQAGGFLELNPLGSQLIRNPLLLALFKLASLGGACWILFRLRHYHGAQVASWWMCLVCTVLTFRWVTFNSLFFS